MAALSHIDLAAQNSVGDCDKKLEAFVENYWQFDTNGLVILIQEETEKFCSDMLPENKCLEGKNKEEIKHFFGESHQVRLNKFMYYTIGTCFTENSEYCMYIHFDFDENGVYQTIGVSGWFKSH
ncbi:hypothetical protein KFE94_07000 [bacterium SCSIO 12643]|nr:hypothetical protein KFE94_07000 [bacterium SCSIO 12643]